MTEFNEVTFRMTVDHDAVNKAIQELEEKVETSTVRAGLLTAYLGLLCSDVIYVPESQLDRFLPFCKRAK